MQSALPDDAFGTRAGCVGFSFRMGRHERKPSHRLTGRLNIIRDLERPTIALYGPLDVDRISD
jgi:hypothetical protein